MPETDLCQYWPRWFREILDFQALCQTEGEELRLMAAFLERVRANLFVQTMDEGTAAVWEAILHITPNPVTEPLSFRRDRVLNRLSMHPPFTLTFLYQRLDALFGPGNWEVEVDYPNYTLYIEAAVEDQQFCRNVGDHGPDKPLSHRLYQPPQGGGVPFAFRGSGEIPCQVQLYPGSMGAGPPALRRAGRK